MKVKLHFGAHAYACIEEDGRKTDIMLSAGRPSWVALRQYAGEQEERARRILEIADLARRASIILEQEKGA